jgi:YHS domain-containing protein
MPIDPACKRQVEINKAAASYNYGSETLYFDTLSIATENSSKIRSGISGT